MKFSKIVVSYNFFLLSLVAGLTMATVSHAQSFLTNNLPQRNEATYRYWGFKVYNARLFVDTSVTDVKESLGKVPMRLELTYTRDLKRTDFIESGEAFMKDNEDVPFEKVKLLNDQMNALYQDVKDGETYAIEYVPGTGTTLYLNGNKKGTVPGELFAASFLGIWLSKYSLSDSFTDKLVRRH